MELAIDQKGVLKNILIEQNSNTVGTTIFVTNNSITKRLMFTQHDKKLSATAMWCRETPEIDKRVAQNGDNILNSKCSVKLEYKHAPMFN